MAIREETWTKSVRSGPEGGQCVEVFVSRRLGVVKLRDSKEVAPFASPGILTVSIPAWASLVEGIKDGEFDIPA